ncbi:MAG: hypothetical protein R6V01_07770 [Thermoplasmatota archaeon]
MNKKEEENEEETKGLTFTVKESRIDAVDTGIARIHSSYLEDIDIQDHHLVSIKSDEGEISVKLVSDKMADKGKVVLRSADMEDLKVKDGSEVTMEPYHTLKEDMEDLWEKFKNNFKKDEEEQEDE